MMEPCQESSSAGADSQGLHHRCQQSPEIDAADLPVRDDAELGGKRLLCIQVAESSQVHRCNGRIYDRNEDGDFDITDNTALVAALYQRKRATYSENRIFPHLGLDDLDRRLLAKCRKIAVLRWANHPWKDMDDLELLKSAQLYQTNPDSGAAGITLAGILLLGKQLPLLNTLPHHRTDLILRKVNLDRYDDRDFVDVNLVESYDRIMAFVHKHLPDPFHLEGTTSISIRDAIFREVASNILIHREYTSAFPAKFIIEYGRVRTENSSRPHGFGRLDPETFTPFPKNPVIAKFFRQIGLADELGSGMRKMMKYSRAYGGAEPELIEGDVFRIIIAVPEYGEQPEGRGQAGDQVSDQATGQVTPEVTPEVRRMLSVLVGEMGRAEIMAALGLKDEKHFREHYQQAAIISGVIEMTIPDKPKSRSQKYRLTALGKSILKAKI